MTGPPVMHIPSNADPLGLALCAALGLDASRVRGLTLRLRVGEVSTVEVESYVLPGDVGAADVPELQTLRYRVEQVTE